MDIGGGNSAAFNVTIDGRGAVTGANEVNAAFNSIKKGANEVSNDVDKTKKSLNGFSSAAQGVAGVFRALGIALGVREIARMADTYKSVEARAKSATRSIAEFNEAFEGIKKLSGETGASMEDTISVFQRLSFVRDELKTNVTEMLTFTGTVQKLGVVSGASTQAMSAGLLQLGQSMSSGIVRAEEFNSIMENIPGVGKAIADQFGVTTGQLRNLVLNGLVKSADVYSAILNEASKATAEYEKMPMTIGRAFNIMLNDLTNFIGEMDKAFHITEIVVGIIDVLRISIAGLGVGLQAVSSLIGTTAALILRGIQSLANGTISVVNGVIELANKVPGIEMGKFDKVDFTGGLGYGDIAKAGIEDMQRIFAQAKMPDTIFDKAFQDNVTQTGGEVREFTKDYKKLAEELGDGKAGKAIKDIADQLENERKVMNLNGAARQNMLQFLEISQQLKKDDVKLSKEQSAQLLKDITTLNALRAAEGATEPFREAAQAVKDQTEVIGLNTHEREDRLKVLQLENDLTKQGVGYTQAQIQAYTENLAKLRQINAQQAIADKLQSISQDLKIQQEVEGEIGVQRENHIKLLEMINDLEREGGHLTAEQRKELELNLATIERMRTEEEVTKPMREIRQQLEQETKLVGLNADARQDRIAVLQYEQQLLDARRDPQDYELEQYAQYVQRVRELREAANQPRPFDEYVKGLKQVGSTIESELINGFKRSSDSLAHFLVTGEGGFKDFGNIVTDVMERIVSARIQASIIEPLAAGGSNIFGSLTKMLGFANGGAFVNGVPVTAFAKGGVVNGPTLFPMANGAGLMGEAGAEAVMPLRRMGNGRLGIEAAGGGGGMVYAPTIAISISGAGGDNAELAQMVKREVGEQLQTNMKTIAGRQGQPSSGMKPQMDSMMSELIGNPNSKVSKSMKQHMGVGHTLGG